MNHMRWHFLMSYGVDTRRGRRVRANTEDPRRAGRTGTIVGYKGDGLRIRWDGDKRAQGPYHPLWALDYLDENDRLVIDGRWRTDELNAMYRRANALWNKDPEEAMLLVA